jgi:hypothetical protein
MGQVSKVAIRSNDTTQGLMRNSIIACNTAGNGGHDVGRQSGRQFGDAVLCLCGMTDESGSLA